MAGGTLCTASGAAMGPLLSHLPSWRTPSSSSGMHPAVTSLIRVRCPGYTVGQICCEWANSMGIVSDPCLRRQPPVDNGVLELYINQFTSATLASPLVGLSVQLEASFFQGSAATANITFAPLTASGTAGSDSRDAAEIALKLRIPSWALSSGVRVMVNGQSWAGCSPTAGPQAGSFCTVRRVFSAGTSCPISCFCSLHHSYQSRSLVVSACTVTCCC